MSLKEILIARDGLSPVEAEKQILEAQGRVMNGEDPEEILYEDFGLEPDYIMDLLPI